VETLRFSVPDLHGGLAEAEGMARLDGAVRSSRNAGAWRSPREFGSGSRPWFIHQAPLGAVGAPDRALPSMGTRVSWEPGCGVVSNHYRGYFSGDGNIMNMTSTLTSDSCGEMDVRGEMFR
jgi:hypothetical protein